MEPEYSLPSSQDLTTIGPYPKPDESDTQPRMLSSLK